MEGGIEIIVASVEEKMTNSPEGFVVSRFEKQDHASRQGFQLDLRHCFCPFLL
jgi:hypothetical protein